MFSDNKVWAGGLDQVILLLGQMHPLLIVAGSLRGSWFWPGKFARCFGLENEGLHSSFWGDVFEPGDFGEDRAVWCRASYFNRKLKVSLRAHGEKTLGQMIVAASGRNYM